jgi:HlyD family secretion protein
MKKTIIIIASIVGVTLLAAWLIFKFWGTKEVTYNWRVVPVEKGDVSVWVTATGTLNADTSVDVGTQVSGIIAKIMVDFNSVVKKGQILAILDTDLLLANKTDANAAMQRAKLEVNQSNSEFVRAKKLYEGGNVSRADYDVAFTSYQTAKSSLVSSRALLNRANISLRYATIRAPISGMVISRNIQIGNMVIASFNSPTLFTIAYDLKKMQVQANVDESDIGQIKKGQAVNFRVSAYPNDVFEGVVTQIRRQPVIVLNVVNYVVIISVANPELKLAPGLTANLNIYIDERKNVYKVQANALSFTPPIAYILTDAILSDSVKKNWQQKLQQKSDLKKQEIVEPDSTSGYVWVKKDKDLFPIKVFKGLSDGTYTEISGDRVREGQVVVVGINTSAVTADTKTTESPFMPKFPKRKKS